MAGDVNSKFSNFFDALQFTQPTIAYSNIGRAATWANVPWAYVSGIPKFWGVGTMVVAMGVVCVGYWRMLTWWTNNNELDIGTDRGARNPEHVK